MGNSIGRNPCLSYFEMLETRSVMLWIMLWIRLMMVSKAFLKVSAKFSMGPLLSFYQKMLKKETTPLKPPNRFLT